MSPVFGACAAVAMGALTSLVVSPATQNLPGSYAAAVLYGAVAIGGVSGFILGSALYRRARRAKTHLALFGGLAGTVSGGIVGAVAVVALLAAYQWSYGSWPPDLLGQVLVVLTYPVFGALGLCAGAMLGLLFGLVAGSALRIVARSR